MKRNKKAPVMAKRFASRYVSKSLEEILADQFEEGRGPDYIIQQWLAFSYLCGFRKGERMAREELKTDATR